MSQMLKSSGAMAAATLTSRVLGMVREMVYASFMGNTWVASAFVMAFQVPNLFRRLLGEGALTAAFIPIFKKKEVQDGEKEMWRSANAVISGLVTAAAAVTVVVVIGITIALAAHPFKEETRLMLRLLRLMFPYMLLVCLAAVFIGMANARGHFFVPAMGAVVLNVVMIGSVLFLAPRMGSTLPERIFGLAIGVVVAGLAQALFQLPSLSREGYRYEWVSPWGDPTVNDVVRKMLPGSIGVAAFQINVLLTQCFSFWFEPSIVSTFNYSVRLMELPQGMFGISLATYLLPTLSGLAAQKNYTEFREVLRQGLGHLAFANLLAASIALVLAEPIVRLLFERGMFGPSATHRVAMALACLAPGLLMFSMNNILARAFYALSDIKTPMKISVLCLLLNLGFAFWLVRYLQQARVGGELGLALANTFSAGVNVGLLTFALRRKLSGMKFAGLAQALLALISDAVLAGLVAGLLSQLWEKKLGHANLALKIGAVFVPGGIAAVVYWLVALWLKVPAATEMTGLLLQKLGGRNKKG
ncbi:MAG TPA: murein biosynthesis integral membrane protein MurJ [Candidatus Limnocylindrales bacterium]|jgi:putative peptidoglycan lipid II flippase|nr:murein biosynthesis integral membrane protein MurJ [Candidatus Limnocylindrales bacterium]